MYRRPFQILLAEPDTLAAYQVMRALKERDYLVASATSANQARWWLDQWPIDLMIAAARIGSERGLALLLAARKKHPLVAGLLTGSEKDRPLDIDARRHGFQLLVRPFESVYLLMVVAELLAAVRRRQRWPRKAVHGAVPVKVAGRAGRVVDVSYGGLRFELDGEIVDVPSPMIIQFAGERLRVEAELVWSARGSDGVSSVCGVALSDASMPDRAWRKFVDRVA
ncbi:MAG: PilZ domain-containing protein [Acidobacteria bacterium]|nr:PilZ domain-containing protein [Acidobacteriota bacterium]